MRQTLRTLTLILILAPASSFAGVYKCTDANGKTSYQEQPCPKTATETKVTTGASRWVLVRSEERDFFMDMASITESGDYVKANFKVVAKPLPSGYTFKDIHAYFFYDCDKQLIEGPFSIAAGGKASGDGIPFQAFREAHEDLPYADQSVVEKVCGS